MRQLSLEKGKDETYDWESLTTDCARPGEDDSFALAEALLEQVEHELVVLHGVEVVDPVWVGAVVEDDVCVRDTFAKVRLKDAIWQLAQYKRRNWVG